MARLLSITGLYLLLSLFLIKTAHCQEGVITSKEMKSQFDALFKGDQRLVSGKFYYGAPQGSIRGNPYYTDEKWKTGFVTINGIRFDSLLLKYDITDNELVLNPIYLNNVSASVCIKKKGISRWGYDNKVFIQFPPDTGKENPRFCEIVSEGPVSYYVLKQKELVVESGNSTSFIYKEYDMQYLKINDELIKFKNKNILFRLYPDLKKQMRSFIRKEGLYPYKRNINDRKLLIDQYNKLLNTL